MTKYLLVKEGKTGDKGSHVALRVHTTDQLLSIVTEQFKDGKHGQTAILELLGDGRLLEFGGDELFEALGVGERNGGTIGGESVINESNQEGHLDPAQSRDGF